ncbi:30S ribosomal protein S9 [Actinoalloteichus hymeniacidonis]|uniref:Small ribosomal subunit protein uS9 n=1 Tax=Actinoalloteichus hymeniacidonis TaxID=340345 RepID=A0AAC9N146_9PSEU|nr:30S ribosomal protein S9 [Actinoalloteichus hymeniacidonis]AOS65762.1 SSU ribosomal protein S9P [Actinoalloteichus hymeniacidonis]MBB5906148.1 small subunit ribosomal protein S9 [Actinoalloteichus hymeniacidonis]
MTAPEQGSEENTIDDAAVVETPEAEAAAVETDVVEGDAVEVEAGEYEAEATEGEIDGEQSLFGDDEEAPVAFVSGPVQTVGRRKEAVVRVRLVPGTGEFKLNGKALEEYFPNKVHQQLIKEPLVTLEKVESFDVFGNLHGGGTSGQAGALRLAIARALIEVDADDRPALKKAGFLTRDSRAKERKKYGLKKARKAPQYSKR